MAVVALIAWIVTAVPGLYLLIIWLIEYDPDFQRAQATRLPVPVVGGHVLFALAGLGSWIAYVITDKKIYWWGAAGALVLIATLGLTMAVRWLGVYRARTAPGSAHAGLELYAAGPDSPRTRASMPALATGPLGSSRLGAIAIPPERHFPVSVVIAHGLFAITTITLVVLTAIGPRGS